MWPVTKTKQKDDNKNLTVIQVEQQITETKTDSLPAPEQSQQVISSTPTFITAETIKENIGLKDTVGSYIPQTEAQKAAERSSLPRTYSNPEKAIVRYYRTWQNSKELKKSDAGKFVTRNSVTVAEDFQEQRFMREASSRLVENGMQEREGNARIRAREKAKLAIPFLKGYHAKTNLSSPTLNSPVSRKDMDIRDEDQKFVDNFVSETGQGRMIALNQMMDTFMKREIPAKQLTEKYVCSHVTELVDRIEQAGAIKELISQYEKDGSDVEFFGGCTMEELAHIKNKVEREMSLRDFITPVLTLNGMTLGWSKRLNRLNLTSGAYTGSNDKHYYKEQADNAWKKLQSLQKEHAEQEEKIKNDRIWAEREALMDEDEGIEKVVDLEEEEAKKDEIVDLESEEFELEYRRIQEQRETEALLSQWLNDMRSTPSWSEKDEEYIRKEREKNQKKREAEKQQEREQRWERYLERQPLRDAAKREKEQQEEARRQQEAIQRRAKEIAERLRKERAQREKEQQEQQEKEQKEKEQQEKKAEKKEDDDDIVDLDELYTYNEYGELIDNSEPVDLDDEDS